MSIEDKSDKIKILVVGLGGIGSQLTELIVPALDISGLNVELNLMDGDVVENNNLAHQRFSSEDENSPKVEVLQQRYQRYKHVKTIAHNNNLTTQSQLEGYDIIVVAVDRQEPRNLVHKSDAHWVDIRCQGDGWLLIDSDTNRSILNKIPNNKQPVGCQLPGAIESGNIEFGFAAVAALGAQWVMQKLRIINGHQSRTPKFSMGYLTHGQMKTSVLEEI
ncbi:MAG: ThiF family adenylyltransferase [Candidatus Poseidoniaceae archaeon]|nr:ThiF family adenylyltransferase [Candidatus Poseidoniaceae archaeon]